jgi:hypothetical protein
MELDLVLSGLRDIHIPRPVSLWPLAMGWWGILIFVISSVSYTLLKKHKSKPKNIWKITKPELVRIQKSYRIHRSEAQSCADLSMLIRRVVLLYYPRTDIASLTGEQWLKFLDNTTSNQDFSNGLGRWVVTAPYMSEPKLDIKQTFSFVRGWLKQLSIHVEVSNND